MVNSDDWKIANSKSGYKLNTVIYKIGIMQCCKNKALNPKRGHENHLGKLRKYFCPFSLRNKNKYKQNLHNFSQGRLVKSKG